MAREVFVICSKYPKCDGPGVAEYQDGIDTSKAKCGFCEAPMRAATKQEIVDYKEGQAK